MWTIPIVGFIIALVGLAIILLSRPKDKKEKYESVHNFS